MCFAFQPIASFCCGCKDVNCSLVGFDACSHCCCVLLRFAYYLWGGLCADAGHQACGWFVVRFQTLLHLHHGVLPALQSCLLAFTFVLICTKGLTPCCKLVYCPIDHNCHFVRWKWLCGLGAGSKMTLTPVFASCMHAPSRLPAVPVFCRALPVLLLVGLAVVVCITIGRTSWLCSRGCSHCSICTLDPGYITGCSTTT
jgi:hypothetical protein